MTTDTQQQTLMIGLSGGSSSGKTTLARLLRGIFNVEASSQNDGVSIKLFVIHEDDFYKTDTEIPKRTFTSSEHGTRVLQDWDCIECLNLPQFDRTVRYVRAHGELPPDMVSIEDQNSVGEIGVSDDEVARLKSDVIAWSKGLSTNSTRAQKKHVTICILDGFLLFSTPPSLLASRFPSSLSTDSSSNIDPKDGNIFVTTIDLNSISLRESLHTTLNAALDLKVFLPTTRAATVQRRARRSGYVTIEGFWQDPPGYVEEVVWPGYARDHGWMFRSAEDVDLGVVDRDAEVLRAEGVVVGPGTGDVSMGDILVWGVGVVKGLVEGAVSGG